LGFLFRLSLALLILHSPPPPLFFSPAARFVAYKDVVRILAEYDDFEYHFDESALAPFVWNEEDKIFITYDDERSIRHKAEYINQRELGGMMYWQMGQDTDDLLLTRTMDDTMLEDKIRLGYWLLDPNDDVDDGRNVPPEDIPWTLLNRVHLSFFNIEGDDDNMGDAPYRVKVPRAIRYNADKYAIWADNVIRMFRERQSQNPDAEIAIAIGGWALGNRNGPDAYAYSAAVKTPESRAELIDSAIDILTLEFIKRDFPEYAAEIEANNYKFEIFDMDWEYPGQETNDKIWDAELGAPVDCFHTPEGILGDLEGCKWGDNVIREDVQGLTLLLREFKAATNGEYKRTIASAGAIYSMSFILQDLTEFVAELENVNVMAYDYAGPWLQRPPSQRSYGYGNVDCRFNVMGWTFWQCLGGYLPGATTAHHTNLYPSIKGLKSLACDDLQSPNTPGCWESGRSVEPVTGYDFWPTSPGLHGNPTCLYDLWDTWMGTGTVYTSERQCLIHNGLDLPTPAPPTMPPTPAPPTLDPSAAPSMPPTPPTAAPSSVPTPPPTHDPTAAPTPPTPTPTTSPTPPPTTCGVAWESCGEGHNPCCVGYACMGSSFDLMCYPTGGATPTLPGPSPTSPPAPSPTQPTQPCVPDWQLCSSGDECCGASFDCKMYQGIMACSP
jgi:GH18 family chitinase